MNFDKNKFVLINNSHQKPVIDLYLTIFSLKYSTFVRFLSAFALSFIFFLRSFIIECYQCKSLKNISRIHFKASETLIFVFIHHLKSFKMLRNSVKSTLNFQKRFLALAAAETNPKVLYSGVSSSLT
jgi:hypothetical protein